MTTSTDFPESAGEILRSGPYNQYWYYAIELVPNVVTPGLKFLNIGLTRRLLAKCDVEGKSCLDIGTMEAAIPVLLTRRSSAHVVGIDFSSCENKIDFVKHYTRARFTYYYGVTHGKTAEFLRSNGETNFDIVILSGVLYHCFGPLNTLAIARSLLRKGGIMIVETFAVIDEQYGMFFNQEGFFTSDPGTYFVPSLPLLDYVLRYLKLAPMDCIHGLRVSTSRYACTRVAVACRAVNDVLSEKSDRWMKPATLMADYVTLIDWNLINSPADEPVHYEAVDRAVRVNKGTGTCDISGTVLNSPQTRLQKHDGVFFLQDLY